ncbi:MAG: hypothetical protein AB7G08_32395 [Hyphomicrobiaceae bacterium]
MANARKTPLDAFRRRQKRHGIVRVEVQVRKEDAALVRSVARALGDPERQAEARSLLKARFAAPRATGLKALLASAPLDGIDLERPRDLGRDVDL